MKSRIVDCHAHIIDPARFPFADGPGYRPRRRKPGRSRTTRRCSPPRRRHALLVQPSGYGFDNSAILDAMQAAPGRFKAIAMLDPTAATGARGPRRRGASSACASTSSATTPSARRARRRASSSGSRRLTGSPRSLPTTTSGRRPAPLRRSGVRLLIDHFGVRDSPAAPASGLPGGAGARPRGRARGQALGAVPGLAAGPA